MPILDRMRRVIAILAGMPGDDKWPGLMQQGAQALEDARQRSPLPPTAANYCHGDFFTLRSGIYHGGGQTQPMNVSNDTTKQKIIDEMGKMDCFAHIGGFATCT